MTGLPFIRAPTDPQRSGRVSNRSYLMIEFVKSITSVCWEPKPTGLSPVAMMIFPEKKKKNQFFRVNNVHKR